MVAVDAHGVTNVATATAKLLDFDLCPRLRDLCQRKLFVPRGWPVPASAPRATAMRRLTYKREEKHLRRPGVCFS